MKISIITVCYNAEETIEETIQSVLAQDYKSIEYIIIDGFSSDSTMEIVGKYKGQIHRVVSEKDKGIYDAMNKGIALANGEVIGILNADDIYASKTVISKIVSGFKGNIDACYGDLQYVKKDNLEHIVRDWKSEKFKSGLFQKGWMPPHPTFFLRKECYDNFGVYNTSFSISADYELMLRMIEKHKIKSNYVPTLITKMRMGGESNASLRHRIRANQEDRRAWRINNLKAEPFTLIRKPLSKLNQYWS